MRRSAILVTVLVLVLLMAFPVWAGGPLSKANGHQTFTPADPGSCPSGTWNVTFNVRETKDVTVTGFFRWTEGDPAVSYSWEVVPEAPATGFTTNGDDEARFYVSYEPNGSTMDDSLQCLHTWLGDGDPMLSGHLIGVVAEDRNNPGGANDKLAYGPVYDEETGGFYAWPGTPIGNVNVRPVLSG